MGEKGQGWVWPLSRIFSMKRRTIKMERFIFFLVSVYSVKIFIDLYLAVA